MQTDMNGNTIYRVQKDGADYYFGSITAIFDIFTSKELGVTKERLWAHGLDVNSPFRNDKCTITKGTIHRKKTNRALPKTRTK